MPALDHEEIKAKIADGSIQAISVDTNVFDKYGCNLTFPVLRRLDQFKNGQIRVLLSEIIKREVQRHIADAAAETQRNLVKALNEQGKRWKIDRAKMAALPDYRSTDDPETLAAEQFQDFIETVSAEVVPALGANDRTSEILDLYFSTGLPFEKKSSKKNEFPDAFALLSLEAHAKRDEQFILCVSADKGWQSYCEASDWLVGVSDLELALAYFNEAGRVDADKAIAKIRLGEAPALIAAVEHAIEYRLDDVDFYADGWSSVEFETEPLGAVLQSVDWQSASAPIVVAADADTVTFTTTLKAKVLFEASFHFSVRDGFDRDYVPLGSEVAETTAQVDLEMVVTIVRNAAPDYEDTDVEVARRHIDVHFGTVEPFQSENPYHEKY